MRLSKSSKQRPTPSCGISPNPSQDSVSMRSSQSQPSKESHFAFSYQSIITPSPEPRMSRDNTLTLPIFTVYSALYHNGIILGIPCVTAGIHRSREPGPHVPSSLHPIKIQLDEVHYSFIDRIPVKDLRHNMIALCDDFNCEDFIADISMIPSFFVEPGHQSWDPAAWSVDEKFRRKWRVLFEAVDMKIRS